ncbi:hypothetical protein LCGC14_1608170, partial [marine sediment metagenome]
GASPTFAGLTLSGLTQGSVMFAGAGGVVSQDNSNLFWDDTNNRLGIGINTGFDPRIGLTISGDMDILHTATEADDHAFEIDVDAATLGDVKAIDIVYTTGILVAGRDEAIMLINIDEIGATGGDIFGLEVLATEGSAAIYGMKVGVVIGPIHQDSGVFINPTLATDNTPTTDVSNMRDGNIATLTTIFEAQNEYIIIGAAAVFEEIEFILATPTNNPGIKPTFWYSSAAGFTQFTPVDGTNGFRNTGVVAWDASDLTGHIVGGVTGTYDIKVIRTKAGSLSPSPVLGYAKTAATTEYIWDKNGDVNINSLAITGTFSDGNYTFDTDGNVSGLGTLGCGAVTSSGASIFNSGSVDADFTVNWNTGTGLFVQGSDGRVGVGTAAPNAPLEVKGTLPGVVGGFYSGHLHVTGEGDTLYSNSVITGHSSYNGNTQLWYLGSMSSSNNDIEFRNRQNAAMHFSTNNTNRMIIDAAGNVGIGLTTIDAGYKLIIRRAADINLGIGLQSSELAIAAFNDTLSANIPMRFYASEYNLLNGKVGINTTTPVSQLSINGGLHVGGDSDAGDNNLLVDGTIGCGVITQSGTTLDNTYQLLDAGLTSLAGLTYAAASFVKMTGANAFALRTIGETADDLEGTIDHANLANLTIAAHDTTGTGANLTSLTDNSIVDTLHRHSELVAPDGSPDPALSIEADGSTTMTNVALGTDGSHDSVVTLNSSIAGKNFVFQNFGTFVLLATTVTSAAALDFRTGAGGGIAFDCGSNYLFRDVDNSFATTLQIASSTGTLKTSGSIIIKEKAAAEGDAAGYGQLWCKDNAGTTELWFTNDSGTDTKIV